ncbi:hypothetical protein OAA59_01220 [bacterium]|nr:hypothetical protein [bacterium]
MKHPLLTTIAAVVLVGADVNAKDGGGQTPLDLAIQQKKPKPPNSSANTTEKVELMIPFILLLRWETLKQANNT